MIASAYEDKKIDAVMTVATKGFHRTNGCELFKRAIRHCSS